MGGGFGNAFEQLKLGEDGLEIAEAPELSIPTQTGSGLERKVSLEVGQIMDTGFKRHPDENPLIKFPIGRDDNRDYALSRGPSRDLDSRHDVWILGAGTKKFIANQVKDRKPVQELGSGKRPNGVAISAEHEIATVVTWRGGEYLADDDCIRDLADLLRRLVSDDKNLEGLSRWAGTLGKFSGVSPTASNIGQLESEAADLYPQFVSDFGLTQEEQDAFELVSWENRRDGNWESIPYACRIWSLAMLLKMIDFRKWRGG